MRQDTRSRSASSSSLQASRQSVLVSRIAAIKAATMAELTSSARLVLRSLADYAGNNAEAWPSVGRLAAECGLSHRQTQRILRDLVTAGWIVARSRRRPDGGQTSTAYTWQDGRRTTTPQAVGAGVGCGISPMTPTSSPPMTPTSSHENSEPENSLKKHNVLSHADFAEALSVAAGPEPLPAVAAPERPSEALTTDLPAVACKDIEDVSAARLAAILPAVLVSAASASRRTTTPQAVGAGVRRGWLTIDSARMSCGRYALERCQAAVAAGLLPPSEVGRLAFLSCWCESLQKFRSGKVRCPAAVLRWLLQNPRAMAEYPTQAAEDKARRILRASQSQSSGGDVG